MAHLSVSLLGGFRVTLNGVSLGGFASIKIRALLAYLATERDRTHPREILAVLLWPDLAQKAAQDSLRNALASLRRTIGDRDAKSPCLLINRESVRWNQDADAWVDVAEFEAAGRQDGEYPTRIEALHAAAAHIHGAFLAGFSIGDSAAFEEWVTLKREQYDRQAVCILRQLADFYESCGVWEQALAAARRQVEIEPWSEEAQRQIMRILAISGQPSAALVQYETCRRLLSDELGIEPSTETQRLYETIRLGRWDEIRLGELLPAPGPVPFKGLQFFDELDAGLFFGRETLTGTLLAQLQTIHDRVITESDRMKRLPSFLTIVGASGSGKSSLLRAGLAPALRKMGWQVTIVTPTESPRGMLDRLFSENLSSEMESRILIADQFEEVFTLCQDELERQEFIEFLLDLALPGQRHEDERQIVVIALCADFYGHCARYPRLREVLCIDQAYIGPMTYEELRMAIEKPARSNGWDFEPGLVELFLQDIGASPVNQAEPGALPLLEHALLETWKHRRGRMLTLKGYAETGGVRGAIAHTADAVYRDLTAEERGIARRIFLRLTALGDGIQDTRRRVGMDEFLTDLPITRKLLRTLADARLITLTEDCVEVAHEALIREWPALRKWLNEGRDALRLHRRLSESAIGWEKGGRDESDLYRGARLAQVMEWAEQPVIGCELTNLEREFLIASRFVSERQAAESELLRQRELEAAYRLAETEQKRADEKNRAAHRLHQEAQLSYAHELAALSRSKLTLEPDLSLLLALRAVDVLEEAGLFIPWLVQQAVHDVALGSRLIWRHETSYQPWHVVFSPGGEEVVFCDDAQKLRIWDAVHGDEIAVISARANHFCVTDSRIFSTDGLIVEVWDRSSRQKLIQIPLADSGSPFSGRVAISPDGRTLAAADCDTQAFLFDLSDWVDAGSPADFPSIQSIRTFPFPARLCRALLFSPDGKWLLTGCALNCEYILWDVVSGEKIQTYRGHTGWVMGAAFSPDGRFLSSGSFDHTARIWDFGVAPGLPASREVQRLTKHAKWVNSVAYCRDGTRLASAGFDGQVIVWNPADGCRLFELPTGGGAYGIDFSPDGKYLVVTTENGSVELWDVTQAGRGEKISMPVNLNYILSHSPAAGSRLFFEIYSDGHVAIRDKVTLSCMAVLQIDPAFHGSSDISMSQDGTLLAVSRAGRTGVWEVPSGRKMLIVQAAGEVSDSASFPPAFSPNGRLLATGGMAGKITVWDIYSQQPAFVLPMTLEAPVCEFSPDGKLLAVGGSTSWRGSGGQVWVWSMGKSGLFSPDPRIFPGDYRSVNHLDFSPDSRYLAVCGCDTHAEIWDVTTCKRILLLQGHVSRIPAIHYSPDGNYLVSVSWDGTAKVWDAQRGEELLSYRSGGPGGMSMAFFTPDSRQVVVYCDDGFYHLLAFQNFSDLRAIVRSRVTRDWKAEEIEKYLHEPRGSAGAKFSL